MRFLDFLFRRPRSTTAATPTAPVAPDRPRVFSVSSTHEYERCPRRYRYGYVDRIPVDRALAPEHWRFGTVVHRGLEAGADAVEIRDHKVTRFVRTPEQLRGDLQLGVYGWLVRRTWPWATQVVGAHHYPLTRELVRVPLDDGWIETAMDRLTTVSTHALTDRVFAPTPGEHCGTCPHTALCDAAPAKAA